MASCSRINVPRGFSGRRGGFTLGELMLVTFISSFVFAGILSAYIFLGRGLTRQGNEEQMESRSRLALYYFTKDVSSASAVDPLGMTTSVMTLYYPDSSDEITYTYVANGNLGTLTRTVTGTAPTGPAVLLTGLSNFSFNYYNFASQAATGAAGIKQINMAFTTIAGLAVSGAQAHLVVDSPRVVMKSKPLLGSWGNGYP
jgi:Tfp pilus assembly protein PilW